MQRTVYQITASKCEPLAIFVPRNPQDFQEQWSEVTRFSVTRNN